MYRRRLLVLAAAAFALGACDDSTSPAGTSSTVAVRAFVDADGTGTFTAGDVPLADLPVTLTATSGSPTYSATTDGEGVAEFTGVVPGSYAAQIAGSAPAGAVLSSAETPVVVAPYQGGTVEAEFRFAYLPGTLNGVLYRDNNGNGQFDAGVDLAAPGLLVELFQGTAAAGEPLAETTTSTAGAFSFATLRPGSYTLVVHPLPTMTLVGGDTIAVTVGPEVAQLLPLPFTGNLIQTVAEVRAEPDDATVAFEGVATVSVGIFSTSTTGNQFNVQDATGGVLLLNVPLSSGIAQGDSVRVVGTKDVSSGEVVIRNPVITKLGTGTVPAPRVVTAAQVATSNDASPLQGLLVSVGNVVVDSVQTGTSAGYNVFVSEVGGANDFVVRVGTAAVGITRGQWLVGGRYDITGTLGFFNGPQVKVRSAADVEARSSATPIGTVRSLAFADSAGTRYDTVTVEGVVHTAQGTFRTDNAYIQDPTGGILLFNVPAAATLQLGDSVRVTAAIDWFNGELELVRFSTTSPPVIEDLGTAATPQPRTISGTQLLSRAYEGQLVRITGAVVNSVGTTSSSGGYDVFLTSQDGASVRVRVESTSIGIPTTYWVPGTRYTITGALAHFRGVPQIKPRSAADVSETPAAAISIAAAEAAAAGDTVTVEGVVIAPVGIFGSATGSSTNAYIQDATGGIQVFGVPAGVTLDLGDLVRVKGVRGVFSGEAQIARYSSTVLLDIVELGAGAPPAPRAVTGADVAARTYEGELVSLAGATVVSVTAPTSSGGYNVTVRAADGTEVLVRHDRTAVGIPSTFWEVGAVYDVTGVLTAFNGAPQLKVRGAYDVVRR